MSIRSSSRQPLIARAKATLASAKVSPAIAPTAGQVLAGRTERHATTAATAARHGNEKASENHSCSRYNHANHAGLPPSPAQAAAVVGIGTAASGTGARHDQVPHDRPAERGARASGMESPLSPAAAASRGPLHTAVFEHVARTRIPDRSGRVVHGVDGALAGPAGVVLPLRPRRWEAARARRPATWMVALTCCARLCE